MSLYYETAFFLSDASLRGGSLKSRIFKGGSNVKSNPATIYALLSQTAKYDVLLKEVIENAGILAFEPKLTPVLSLLLVHDHLFAKKGIAATTNHPLRLAVERHRARLQAELTKCRIKRGYASIDELKRNAIERATSAHGRFLQPRWVRVNRLKSTVQQQISQTFSEYIITSRLVNMISNSPQQKLVYIDQQIPDLLASPPEIDLTKTQAYKNGQLILQDKASCFPACLLLDGPETSDQGDILDACASPGNKTTHLASILSQKATITDATASRSGPKIWACERDQYRSQTLQKMVTLAGAENVVTVLAKQDFLALDPADVRFKNVTHLLLDPSCSGSGILGRDEVPVLQLPHDPKLEKAGGPTGIDGKTQTVSRKRKRRNVSESDGNPETYGATAASQGSTIQSEKVPYHIDFERLEKLANLQTMIIEHAFSFPSARRIVYSTCSVHVHENEAVVSRALTADIARNRGWRVMNKWEQPDGLRTWPHRGLKLSEAESGDIDSSHRTAWYGLSEEERQACIRCEAGDKEGTMGFFVCGFIRNEDSMYSAEAGCKTEVDGEATSYGGDEEWGGFSDTGDILPTN